MIRTWGDGSFWTVNLDLRRYQPTWRRQHLLLSGLATFQSGTVGQDVPVYLTYYLGGANTIRGYQLEALGPTLNGKNQLLTTAEYNIKLLDLARRDVFRWSFSVGLELALFADAGIAWNESPQFGWKRFRGGLGAGPAPPRPWLGTGPIRPGVEPAGRRPVPFRERDQARGAAAAAALRERTTHFSLPAQPQPGEICAFFGPFRKFRSATQHSPANVGAGQSL